MKHKAHHRPKLIQTSKEFFDGKWQKVNFYKHDNGDIVMKPAKGRVTL